ATPDAEPVRHRYPAAGAANADVSLWHVDLDGNRRRIEWDVTRFPYLTRVSWSSNGPPLLQVMSREQRHAQILSADPGTGATSVVREQQDGVWLDLFPGVPVHAPQGRLVTVEPSEDTNRVVVDGQPVSPV